MNCTAYVVPSRTKVNPENRLKHHLSILSSKFFISEPFQKIKKKNEYVFVRVHIWKSYTNHSLVVDFQESYQHWGVSRLQIFISDKRVTQSFGSKITGRTQNLGICDCRSSRRQRCRISLSVVYPVSTGNRLPGIIDFVGGYCGINHARALSVMTYRTIPNTPTFLSLITFFFSSFRRTTIVSCNLRLFYRRYIIVLFLFFLQVLTLNSNRVSSIQGLRQPSLERLELNGKRTYNNDNIMGGVWFFFCTSIESYYCAFYFVSFKYLHS